MNSKIKEVFRSLAGALKRAEAVAVTDSRESDEELHNKAVRGDMTAVKYALLLIGEKKALLLTVLVLLIVVTAAGLYISSGKTAEVVMSANYQESSKGLNPNSTRLNVYELTSEPVMRRALSYMGNDRVDPHELADNISVTNTNQRTIDLEDPSSYFVSTSFLVTYNRNKNMGRFTTDEIMSAICRAYNDTFHDDYGDKVTALTYEMDSMADMEYVEIGDEMTAEATKLTSYLEQRIKENGTFKSENTGETFQTLKRQVQNLKDYDIEKYRSYVLETGLAKNKIQFLQTLQYSNSVLDMRYQKEIAQHDVRRDGVDQYDAAMIGIVMIPSVNDKEDYYMSRTNIGIDYLARDAEDHLMAAKEILKQIEINNDIISKLSTRTPTAENYKTADTMLSGIHDQFVKISQIAIETDKEYIKYDSKNYLTFMNRDKSFLQKIQIKKLVVASVFYLVVLCMIFYFVGKRKFAEIKEVHV